jgi:hypothetical protein
MAMRLQVPNLCLKDRLFAIYYLFSPSLLLFFFFSAEIVEAPAPEDPALVLARKGAILALRSIVSQYGAQLFDSLPKLWDNMIQPVSLFLFLSFPYLFPIFSLSFPYLFPIFSLSFPYLFLSFPIFSYLSLSFPIFSYLSYSLNGTDDGVFRAN